MKKSYVYFLTNKYNTTLYIGVTSNLIKRLYEHQQKLVDGFTKRYNLNKLVYFEEYDDILTAIEREKYLKGKKRIFKNKLVETMNPKWEDLGEKYNINSHFEAEIKESQPSVILNECEESHDTMRCFADAQHDSNRHSEVIAEESQLRGNINAK